MYTPLIRCTLPATSSLVALKYSNAVSKIIIQDHDVTHNPPIHLTHPRWGTEHYHWASASWKFFYYFVNVRLQIVYCCLLTVIELRRLYGIATLQCFIFYQ